MNLIQVKDIKSKDEIVLVFNQYCEIWNVFFENGFHLR